jgi:transcription termination factor 2
MGLGKTLSMISLIACQKENQPILPSESDINDPNGGTLIICPSVVLGNLILYKLF